MIQLLIQTVVFLSYVIFIYKKFGILDSISESWYRLIPYNLSFLFTFFCVIIGFLMASQSIRGENIFYILSGAGLCFTGVAGAFKWKESQTNIVHFAGATIAIFGALIGLWVQFNFYIPFIIFGILTILIKLLKIQHSIWWIEIVAFSAILIGIFFSLL
jgi:hypothetical protein